MWFLNQTSPATRVSLTYITVGALTVVWTSVWMAYLYNNPPTSNSPWYLSTGFLVTGMTLLVIGFCLGWIGRASRPADDLPPHRAASVQVPAQPNGAVASMATGAPAAPANTAAMLANQPAPPITNNQAVLTAPPANVR